MQITTGSVMNKVNTFFNLDIRDTTRKEEYVRARAIYYKLCRDLVPSARLEHIGSSVNRDHSSVSIALRKFDNDIKYDDKLKKEYILITDHDDELVKKDAVIFKLRSEIYDLQLQVSHFKVGNLDIEVLNKLNYLVSNVSVEDARGLLVKLDAIYNMNVNLIK